MTYIYKQTNGYTYVMDDFHLIQLAIEITEQAERLKDFEKDINESRRRLQEMIIEERPQEYYARKARRQSILNKYKHD